MSSTVAGVKAALVTLIRGALPTDTQVLYGPATVATEAADNVVTVGTVTGVSELDNLSATTTAEDYVVEITISASMPGADTMQAATETVLAYWLTMKAAVLAAVDLGVTGVLAARPVGDFEVTEYAGEFGRSAALKTGVHVRAFAV